MKLGIYFLLFCLISWVLISPINLKAQTDSIPANVRQQMNLFVQALNSGQTAELEKFIRGSHHPKVLEQVPMDLMLARWLTVHNQTGAVEARIFKSLSPTTAIVWTRGTVTKVWVGFQFFFGKDAPHLISAIARDSGPMPPVEERLAPTKTPKELSARMNQYLDEISKTPYFSGSVLIAHHGKIIVNRNLGKANIAQNIPNQNKTIYNIASISKMFVGVAIAQLAEKGLLDYQDKLSKFIPEYPKHIADQVTIHHLLTHTSGIELDEIREFNEKNTKAKSVKDLIDAQIEFLPKMEGFQNFKRPEEYNYTNEGYALLARIVEVVSKKNYFDYLWENIFKPAKMQNTFAIYQGKIPPRNLAIGYTNQNPSNGAAMLGALREVSFFTKEFRHPAGGIDSTTTDLSNFVNAVFRGKLLKKSSINLLSQSHIKVAESRSYGYGLMIDETIAGKRIGHSGANMGFSSRLDYYPETGYTVIILCNQDRVANSMADLVTELLSGK
jgi:CubicO group peptidase (beta-lactamase class C family)